jgi:hypothetical protein
MIRDGVDTNPEHIKGIIPRTMEAILDKIRMASETQNDGRGHADADRCLSVFLRKDNIGE